MAKKLRAKLVMELLAEGMSMRTISSTRHIAHQGIRKVREAAKREGVAWEDVRDLDDAEVYSLLFPSASDQEGVCIQVDYGYVLEGADATDLASRAAKADIAARIMRGKKVPAETRQTKPTARSVGSS